MSSRVKVQAGDFSPSPRKVVDKDEDENQIESSSATVAFGNMDVYEGDVAELSGSEIRLLLVHPGPLDSPITTELVKRNIDDSLDYDALSYVWGNYNHRQPHSITCNEKTFIITPNLMTALQHLRLESGIRTIWVDAICINQANLDERSDQVAMMFRIYRSASKVCAWLGTTSQQSEGLRDYLDLLPPHATSLGEWVYNHHIFFRDHPLSRTDYDLRQVLNQKLIRDQCFVDELHKLFDSKWFSRVWILQEAAANKNLELILGRLQLSWNKALYLAMLISLENKEDGHLVRILRWKVTKARLVGMVREQIDPSSIALTGGCGLQDIMAMSTTCKATDDRDRVFALLSLVTDKYDLLFLPRPDYNRTYAEAMEQTSIAIIHAQSASLNFLAQAGRSLQRFERWPSWIPDYANPQQAHARWKGQAFCGPFQGGGRISVNKLTSRNVLICHGNIRARVSQTSDPPIFEQLTTEKLKMFLVHWEGILQEVSNDWTDIEFLTKYHSLISRTAGDIILSVVQDVVSQSHNAAEFQEILGLTHPNVRSRHLFGLFMNDWQPAILDGYHPAFVCIGSEPGDEIAEVLGSEHFLTLRRREGFHEIMGRCFVGESRDIPFPCVQSCEWQRSREVLGRYLHLSTTGRWRRLLAPGWVQIIHEQPDFSPPEGWVRYKTKQFGLEKAFYTWCYHTETLQRINVAPVQYGEEYNPAENFDPIPPGWEFVNLPSSYCTHNETGQTLARDPRYTDNTLGPIPDGWTVQRVVHRSQEDERAHKPYSCDLYFVNLATGDWTREDPCLAEDFDIAGFEGLRIM
ncbi:heterokaryon incompatibility protein-domain-containing protein [Dendryphion nanum]|uniref:Heterokaryon incompatibility protein-domain-containing protein n=1 Tax=Dendryphion nanum TaxID=256645 RepID=A0A9P9ITU8_9PLEO|nr:heterokaryon incompatibility protein-domain-containing protein [Dendryphion nanum]